MGGFRYFHPHRFLMVVYTRVGVPVSTCGSGVTAACVGRRADSAGRCEMRRTETGATPGFFFALAVSQLSDTRNDGSDGWEITSPEVGGASGNARRSEVDHLLAFTVSSSETR